MLKEIKQHTIHAICEFECSSTGYPFSNRINFCHLSWLVNYKFLREKKTKEITTKRHLPHRIRGSYFNSFIIFRAFYKYININAWHVDRVRIELTNINNLFDLFVDKICAYSKAYQWFFKKKKAKDKLPQSCIWKPWPLSNWNYLLFSWISNCHTCLLSRLW